MRLLYCDESNIQEKAGDFLIYGGIIVDAAKSKDLSQEMDDLRKYYGIESDFRLKFNPGPQHLSHADFISVKQSVMEVALAHGVQLLAYVILHDVATNPDEARRNGINTVCYHFDCVLNRLKEPGLVLIDRFNDAGNQIDAHLVEKFSKGVTGLPYSPEMRLSNIVGFHYSCIGQSHFPSILDVVIGSLRLCLNAHTQDNRSLLPTAEKLLGIISPMFYREGEDARVSELGFTFSPKVVRADRYRQKYDALKGFLAANGVETAQRITSERQY